jgi:hypothetical protein
MPASQWPGKYALCCELVVATAVVTAIDALVVVAVPLAAIVAGANRQAASEGRPEQARLIVPLNPVEFETLIDVVPVPPAAEITTVDCAAEIVP